MAKFEFELESILEIRNFEKQQAENELAASIAQENRINDDIKQLAFQYTQSKNQIKDSKSFDDFQTHSQYTKLLNYQKEVLLEELAQAKLISEQKRKVVLECMKKTTALEKMKEIKYAEFKTEQKMKEKKQQENLAAIKSFSDSIN